MSPALKPLPDTADGGREARALHGRDPDPPDLRLVRAEDLARVRVLDLLADAVDRELVAFLHAAVRAGVQVQRAAVHVRDLADEAGGVAVAAHAGRLDVRLRERRRELRDDGAHELVDLAVVVRAAAGAHDVDARVGRLVPRRVRPDDLARRGRERARVERGLGLLRADVHGRAGRAGGRPARSRPRSVTPSSVTAPAMRYSTPSILPILTAVRGIDVAREREVLLLHDRRELLALDDAVLAALDELGHEHVLRAAPGVVPVHVVVGRLVLELQNGHARLVALRDGRARREGAASRREDARRLASSCSPHEFETLF